MASRITVLVNSKAGVGDKGRAPDTLGELFRAEQADAEIIAFDDGCELIKEAQRAVDRGCEIVVAAGGDGTVSAVAGVVAGTSAALGVLPLGTLNHFAKDLGIPLALEEAVRTIVAGNRKKVDVGEVNGRVFVNNSSVGMYPQIVHRREQYQQLGSSKWSAFARAFWTIVGRYPLIHVTLKSDGKQITRKTPLVFIGNNRYEIHGLKLGTRKSLDCGTLAVYLTRDVGRLRLLSFAARALLGSLREDRDFEYLETAEVALHSRRRHLRVAADGEVMRLDTPLEYRMRPGALTVIVPQTPKEPEAADKPASPSAKK